MESGTIWQLSLLRKLSSVSPNSNYLNKFKHFRSLNKHAPRKQSCTINTSREMFRKYPQSQRQLTYAKVKSHSLQRKVNRIKKSTVEVRESTNLSGWNVQNEEEIMYAKLLQKNNFSFFNNQLKKIKKQHKQSSPNQIQNKFPSIEQDLNQFFKQSNIQSLKREPKISGPRNKKLKPLIIDQIMTQENTSKQKPFTYIDKQNFLIEELVLICPSKINKIAFSNKSQKLNGLVKGFSSQLNRKRIC